jgi:hypothetical protein
VLGDTKTFVVANEEMLQLAFLAQKPSSAATANILRGGLSEGSYIYPTYINCESFRLFIRVGQKQLGVQEGCRSLAQGVLKQGICTVEHLSSTNLFLFQLPFCDATTLRVVYYVSFSSQRLWGSTDVAKTQQRPWELLEGRMIVEEVGKDRWAGAVVESGTVAKDSWLVQIAGKLRSVIGVDDPLVGSVESKDSRLVQIVEKQRSLIEVEDRWEGSVERKDSWLVQIVEKKKSAIGVGD